MDRSETEFQPHYTDTLKPKEVDRLTQNTSLAPMRLHLRLK